MAKILHALKPTSLSARSVVSPHATYSGSTAANSPIFLQDTIELDTTAGGAPCLVPCFFAYK